MIDFSKVPEKKPIDIWRECLAGGDLLAIMKEFKTNREVELNPERCLQDVFAVVQKKAGTNIDGLIDQLFREAFATTAEFMLRSKVNLQKTLGGILPRESNLERSVKLLQAGLDQWELQLDNLMRLTGRYASIRHTLKLSELAQPAESQTTRPISSRAATTANGTSAASQPMTMPPVKLREAACA